MKRNEIELSEKLNSQASIIITRASRFLFCATTVAISFVTLPEMAAARPGNLDPTFGARGKVQTAFGANSSYGCDIAL